MSDPSPTTLSGPSPASFDEKLKEFDAVPLFMRSLPTENDDALDTTAIEALQSLVHEGTPDGLLTRTVGSIESEIAQNFKEQGNDYFKGKRFREAQGFYTQGLNAKPTNEELMEALLCNRAACNLQLQNFGSVLKDCAAALKLNPKSSKAFYRAALALTALGREEEAIDGCDRCLRFDPSNSGVKVVRDRANKALEAKMAVERARQERERDERRRKSELEKAFKERNLVVIENPSGTSENPYRPHFVEEGTEGKKLVIPTMFLYPQHATSDMISHFVEDTRFDEHIATMFPPDGAVPGWDTKGEYLAGQLVVYAIAAGKRLLKVGKKMRLSDIMSAARDGLEVRDGCLSFIVLPKGSVENDWVESFKKSRSDEM